MKKLTTWQSSDGSLLVHMSPDMSYDCSQPGCDAEPFIASYFEDSEHYEIEAHPHYKNMPLDDLIAQNLEEYGAWTREELMNDPEMSEYRLLWIVANDIREGNV